MEHKINTLADAQADINSLWVNYDQLMNRLRYLEKVHYIHDSPLRRRILWSIDGWPWRRYVEEPQWRPWRRWWRS